MKALREPGTAEPFSYGLSRRALLAIAEELLATAEKNLWQQPKKLEILWQQPKRLLATAEKKTPSGSGVSIEGHLCLLDPNNELILRYLWEQPDYLS